MRQTQQTIFKSSPSKNFVVLPNNLVRDKTISFRARGLLAMALSNNDEWKVNKGWLESQSEKEGREATNSALSELRKAGYVVFYKRHRGGGLIENVWEFYDTPGHKAPADRTTASPYDGKTVARLNRPPGKPSPSEETSTEETLEEENKNGCAPPSQSKTFQKPSIEAVKLQGVKIELPANECEKFFDYYESNGWRVGKNQMKLWTAALSNWKRNWSERFAKPNGHQRFQRPAPNFEDRDPNSNP